MRSGSGWIYKPVHGPGPGWETPRMLVLVTGSSLYSSSLIVRLGFWVKSPAGGMADAQGFIPCGGVLLVGPTLLWGPSALLVDTDPACDYWALPFCHI